MRVFGSSLATCTLVAALVAGAIGAACGGAGAPAAQSPATQAPAGAPANATTGSAAATSAGTGATPAPTEGAPPPPLTTSVEIAPSNMIADLKAIGIDPANPGELSKIEMSKKKKLMGLFVKALGVPGCISCHTPGDFKADTHEKQMATGMWNHFVKDLRAKGGAPLFCDSCHQGKSQLLARSDKKALSAFMRTNYEEKLERADKKDHSCTTCHTDTFEGKIFAKVWKVAPEASAAR